MRLARGQRVLCCAVLIACFGASAALAQSLAPHVTVLAHDGSSYARKLNGSPNVAPREAVAQRFYREHRDEYEFLVVFPAFETDFEKEAIGLNNLVRNDVAGIGLPIVDVGLFYGSRSRLRAYIDVGSLSPLVRDSTVEGALGVIAHEIEHAWGPAVRFRDPSTGAFSDDLLGLERAHWSFFLDSNASVMFGSRWQAAGSGTFTAVESRRRYSDLDLYLMGFLPPGEVADFSLLVPTAPGRSATDLPPLDGTRIAATARTIHVADVIAAEGPRVPSAANAPRLFRAAFVLLLAPGQSATPAQLSFVDAVRAAWENEFFFLTRGLAIMETELVERIPQSGSTAPTSFTALQRTDGSWADSPGTAVRDTQVALEALALMRNQPGTPAAVARGAAYLASLTPANVDEAARRVMGLAAAQADASIALQDLDRLITLRHGASHGYALGSGYEGTPVDSILAGLAHLAAGADPAALSDLTALIAAWQNRDGGWPYVAGGPSRIEPTALALHYFRQVPQAPTVVMAAGRALGFLGTRRNERPEELLFAGAHYSDDLASAPGTALAAIALLEWEALSRTDALALQRSLTDLVAGASATYPSAIAVKALRLLQVPNPALSPSDVSLNSYRVYDGETVIATALVRNPGGGAVPPTALRVYDSAGRVLGGTVVAVDAMATTTVRFPLDTTGHAGSTQAFFVVNADGALDETRSDDDRVALPLVINDRPDGVDLFAVAGSLVSTPAVVAGFPTTLSISGQVGNLGRQGVAGVTVSVSVQGRAAASTSVDLPANSVLPVSFQVQVASGAIEVPVVLVVDPQNAFAETRKDNNSATLAVPIVPRTSVVIDAFTASSTTPTQGNDVALSLTVRNAGTLDSGRLPVSVTVRDAQGVVVATPLSDVFDLPPGGSASRQAPWKATAAGTFTVRLGIADQTATVAVQVTASGLPNLAVALPGIAVLPAPAVGKTSQVGFSVMNAGSDAGPFAVDVYAGDPAQGHRLGRQPVSALAAGSTVAVRVPFTPDSPHPVVLVAVVDPDDAVHEFDETDNRAVLTVTPLSLPDLVIADADVRPESVLLRTGSLVPVSVTVHNAGEQDAAQVPVDLWLGDPAQGGRRLGSRLLSTVPGSGSSDAQFTWDTTGLSGPQTLVAVANAGGAVTESDPGNDRGARSVLVQDGAIAVTNSFISPNDDGIQDFTDLYYRVPDGSASTVTVLDAQGSPVRTLRAGASTSATVRWDGRNEQGVVVADGAYVVDVAAGAKSLGRVQIIVDDNRSLVEDAAGRGELAFTQLPALPVSGRDGCLNSACFPSVDSVTMPAMMPDDSGFVYSVRNTSTCTFYLQPADGGESRRLSPDWSCTTGAPASITVSPDAQRIVFTTGSCAGTPMPAECNSIRAYSLADQRFTTVLHVTDVVKTSTGTFTWLFDDVAFTQRIEGQHAQQGVVFSPAGDKMAYRLGASRHGTRIEVANADGTGRVVLPGLDSFPSIGTYRFSPDGSTVTTQLQAWSPSGQPLGRFTATAGASPYDWMPDSSRIVTTDSFFLVASDYPFVPVFPGLDFASETTFFDTLLPVEWRGDSNVSVAVSPSTSAVLLARHPDIRMSKPLGAPTVPLWTVPGGDIANVKWAPHGSYLLLLARDPLRLKPDGFNGYAVHVLSSLANLTARISASHDQGSGELTFTGTATDQNFSDYEIDVRPHTGSGAGSVVVRSDVPVIDGLLGRWVPPAPGIYDATLIARDRAGNIKSSRTAVAWSKQAVVANLSVSPTYISPNGDGVQDTTTFAYTVLTPLTTQFHVVGPDQSVVRRFDRTHIETGTYSLVWDGRDEAGNVVPDGKYLFRAESGGVAVIVDRTPPLVFQAFANGEPPDRLPSDQASLDFLADSIDLSHGFMVVPHSVLLSGFFRSQDKNGVSWTLEQSATPDFADARVIGSGTGSDWWGYPRPPLPISDLRGTWTRLTARDAAGNLVHSRPRAMADQLFFVGAGDASLLGPDLDTGALPWTKDSGVPFAPGRFAFKTAFSGASRIVSYAVRYPSATGSGVVDVANVQQLAEDVFVWDARGIGWPVNSLDIDAIDDRGRPFTVKVPLQESHGTFTGLTACLSAAPPAIVLGTNQDAPMLADAHIELRQGFGAPERVVDFQNPFRGDGYSFTIPTSNLAACHYDVFFSGHDLRGRLFSAQLPVDVCGMALTEGPKYGANAKAAARIASSFPGNIVSVDVFLTGVSGTKRVASAGAFYHLSEETLLDLTGFPGCQSAGVSFVAHLADGTSWRSSDTRDATRMCGGTTIVLPCISLALGAAHRDGDAAFCASRDPVFTFPLSARTDKPGGSIVRVEAVLKSMQTLAVQPLPVAPFNSSAAVTSSVAVPTAPLAEGLYALGVKIVDEAGVSLQTGVDFATGRDLLDGLDFSNVVAVDRVPPRAGVNAPLAGARVCAARTPAADGTSSVFLPVGGFASDPHLEAYAVLLRRPGESAYQSLDLGVAFGPNFSTARQAPFTGLPSGDYELAFAGRDVSGSWGCSNPVPVHVDAAINVSQVGASPAVFSPDGDGVQDFTSVAFSLDEPGQATVSVQRSAGSWQVLDSSARPAGNAQFAWDGSAGGAVLPDGNYALRVEATDSCGNRAVQEGAVTIDTVGPIARIDSPTGGTAGAVLAVLGQASDANFRDYELSLVSGSATTVLAQSTSSAAGALGSFDLRGFVPGSYVLRLLARDLAGHSSTAEVPLTVVPPALIDAFRVAPVAISPGRAGAAVVATVTLRQSANATVSVLDGLGTTVAVAFGPAPLPTGATPISLDAAVASLANDSYRIRLTASTGGTTEIADAALAVDRAAPSLRIDAPAAGAFVSGAVEVTGSIFDPLLSSWSISIKPAAGTESVIATGTSPRSGLFAVVRGLSDGAYQLIVRASDTAGNDARTDVSFTEDSRAPAVSFAAPRDGSSISGRSGPLRVVVSVTEPNLARLQLDAVTASGQRRLYDGPLPAGGQLAAWDVAAEADGPASLTLIAQDRAGNATTAKASVGIDNTLPTARIDSPRDGFLRAGFPFSGTALDTNLTGWSLAIAKGVPASPAAFSMIASSVNGVSGGVLAALTSLPADGAYTARLSVLDRAGNESVDTASFVVDTTPPAPPPSLSATVVQRTIVQLVWTASPDSDVTGYVVERATGDSTNFQPVTTAAVAGTTWTDSGLFDRVYHYRVRAQDAAGLIGRPSPTASATIHATPPQVAIFRPLNGTSVGGSLDVIGAVTSFFPLDHWALSLDGATPMVLARGTTTVASGRLASVDTGQLPQGTQAFVLEAADVYGNAARQTVMVRIDDQPPAAPVLVSATAAADSVLVTWTATPDLDVIGYLLYRNGQLANAPDGASVTDVTRYLLSASQTSQLDPGLPDGTFTYQLQAVDAALNSSVLSNALDVTIEQHAPSARIVSPNSLASVPGPFTIVADVADLDVASVQFEARSGGSSFAAVGAPRTRSPWTVDLDPSTFPSPVLELHAVATDRSGHADPKPPSAFVFFDPLLSQPSTTARTDGQAVNVSWTDSDPPERLGAFQLARDAVSFGVATNKPAGTTTASSGNAAAGYDSDTFSLWQPTAAPPHWWRVDLAKPTLVRSLSTDFFAAAQIQADVSVKLKGVWVPVGTLFPSNQSSSLTLTLPRPLAIEGARYDFTVGSGAVVGIFDERLSALPTVAGSPFADAAVPLGTHAYVLTAWSPFGQTALANASARVYAPTLNPLPAAVGQAALHLSGQADPGAIVHVLLAGVEVGTSVAGADGAFTATVTLAPGTNVVSVQATDSAGNRSVPSSPTTVVLDPAPAAVPLLTASASGSKVSLSWSLTGDRSNVAGVLVSRGVGLDAPAPLTVVDAQATSFADLALLNGDYTYVVAVVNQHLFAGPASNVAVVHVAVDPPGAPTNLVVSAAPAGRELDLSWSASAGAVTGYAIDRAVANGPFETAVAGLSGTSWSDVGLTDGVRYSYRVVALDAVGNRSAPSNVASGIPRDSSVPAAPEIRRPTTSGTPLSLGAAQVSVGGTAGAGTTVHLFQNGTEVGTSLAQQQLAKVPVATARSPQSFAASRDGSSIAYQYASPTGAWVAVEHLSGGAQRFENASVTMSAPSLSSDGTKVAFIGRSTTTFQYSLYAGDVSSGTSTSLAAVPAADRSVPSWAPDGNRIAYVRTRSALAVYDLVAKNDTLIASDSSVDFGDVAWVGPDAILAVVDTASRPQVRRYDLVTHAFRVVYFPNDFSLPAIGAVSADGATAALLVSFRNKLAVVDVTSGAQRTPVDTAFQHAAPTFSLDGRTLSYIADGELLVADTASAQVTDLGPLNLQGYSGDARMASTAAGVLVFDPAAGIFSVAAGTLWSVDGLTLARGENVFFATAQKPGGPSSAPSQPISVAYDTAQLPDLVVTAEIQPHVPIVGESATAVVTVRNVGRAATDVAPDVAVTVFGADGSVRAGRRASLAGPLAPGDSAVAVVPLDLSGLVGEQKVSVRVDPDLRVVQSNRENDEQTISLLVAASASPALAVELSPAAIGVSSTALATVTFANPGATINASVRVRLVDSGGNEVLVAAPDEAFTSSAGDVHPFTRPIPSGTILAGSYRVVAEGRAADVLVASARASLEILPDRAVALSLAPRSAAFSSGDPVGFDTRIANASRNSLLAGASLELAVTDEQGVTVFSTSVALPLLAQGSAVAEPIDIPSPGLPSGSYTATAGVRAAGAVRATAFTQFSVLGQARLEAGLEVVGGRGSPVAVPSGPDLKLRVAVSNSGDAVATGVELQVTMLDPGTGTATRYQALPIGTLVPGEAVYLGVDFATAGLPLQTYSLSVAAVRDGARDPERLATRLLRIADSHPPLLSIRDLAPGMFVRGVLQASVRAQDDYSGTAQVRVSVDGSAPRALAIVSGNPLDGVWSVPIRLQPDGPHTFVFSAADAEGNDGATAPSAANPVAIAVVSDSIAPAIVLGGVGEGALVAIAVAPTWTASDLNLASATATLNGQPFASGTPVEADGDYLLSASAVDQAGNQTVQSRAFSIDRTAPTISISGVAAGEFSPSDVLPVVSVSDAHPDVASVKLDGLPFFGGTVTAEGLHVLQVSATDRVGNHAETSRAFVIDKTPPLISLGGVVDGQLTSASVVPVFGATDLNLATVTATLNGAPFTSGSAVASEGDYSLVITATDLAGHQTSRAAAFVIDRTPPRIEVSGFVDGGLTAQPVTVIFTASDPHLASVDADLNGTPFVSGTTVRDQGAYALVVTAVDRAGNRSQVARTFTIDTTPPVVAISGFVNGSYVAGDVTPTYGSTSPDVVTISGTLNGAAFASGGTVTAEGPYTLLVRATDAAGNVASASASFTIDKSPPTVDIQGLPPSGYSAADVLPSFSAQDVNLSTVVALLNGAPFASGTLVSAEGSYDLAVTAFDKAGNKAVRHGTFVIDRTPPVISVSGVVDGGFYAGPVTPTFSASDDFPTSVTATLDQAVFTSGTAVRTEGGHVLVVTAQDRAGNVSSRRVGFTVDTASPTISIVGVTDGQYTNAAAVIPVFSGADTNLASVSAALDGAPFTSGSSVTSEGTHRLQVSALDKAGNSAAASATFTLDRTPPAIHVSGVSSGATYEDAVTPVVSVSDASPVSTVVALNAAPFVSGTLISDDGDYVLDVSATDRAGNASRVTVSFTVLQVRYSVAQALAQRVPAVLALMKAGKCALPPTEQARVSAFLKGSLGAPDALLTIVADETAFLSGMRSGLYGLFVWVSLDATDPFCRENQDATCNSVQCATRLSLSRELTELVYSGRGGLVVVRNRTENLPGMREVLGVDAAGSITAASATFLSGGALAGLPSVALGSTAAQLNLLLGVAAGGYDGVSRPAAGAPPISAASHSFGQGIGITFAYDVSAATPVSSASVVLGRAAAAASPASPPLGPLSVASLEISVTNLVKPASTRIRQTVPPPVAVVAAAPPASLAPGLLEWDRDLGTGEVAVFRSFLRIPDLPGTSTVSTEVAVVRAAGVKVFGTYSFDLAVREGGRDLQANADAAAALLPDSGHDGAMRAQIRAALSNVQARAVAGKADIEANLLDLLDAIDAAKTLKSVDPTGVRLALDELVRYWEARWSVY